MNCHETALRAAVDEIEHIRDLCEQTIDYICNNDDGEISDAMRLVRDGLVDVVAGSKLREAAGYWRVGFTQEERMLLVNADSELSAIAHGRPPSSAEAMQKIADGLRTLYETR